MQLLKREVTQIQNQERSPKIVLAESSLTTAQLILNELGQDLHLIATRDNFEDIDKVLSLQTTDLLILGNIDGKKFLDTYQRYSCLYENMPIILLTNERTVNPAFRNWAISKGFFDVLSSHPQNLYLLRGTLLEFFHALQIRPQENIKPSIPMPESKSLN